MRLRQPSEIRLSYLRNSVADAIETYSQIDADVRPLLFHARFAMCDRLSRQTRCSACSASTAVQRRVVVAS